MLISYGGVSPRLKFASGPVCSRIIISYHRSIPEHKRRQADVVYLEARSGSPLAIGTGLSVRAVAAAIAAAGAAISSSSSGIT